MEKAKYDPEDIESLLANKNFSELYPEEKEFVLRHLDNETEYLRMRETLIGINIVSEDDVLISPSEKTKETLMDIFESKHRKRPFLIWLNELFATVKNQTISLFAQPRFAYSLATVCIALIGWFIWDGFHEEKMQLAEHQTEELKLPDKDLEVKNSESAITNHESNGIVSDESQIANTGSDPLRKEEQIESLESNKATDNSVFVNIESADEDKDFVATDNDVTLAVPPLILEEPQARIDSEIAEIINDDTEDDTRIPSDVSVNDLTREPAITEKFKTELDEIDSDIIRNKESELADQISPTQIEEVTIAAQSKRAERVQVMSNKADKITKDKGGVSLTRSAKADLELMELLFTAL